jgi:hypothetical protein
MDGALLTHTFLLVTAAFAGLAVGLVAFAVVRFGARHAFGQALVRDHVVAGGPFRGGVSERLVARDAPLAVRLLGALALGVSCADALLHLALGGVEWAVLAHVLGRAHRAEVGPGADTSFLPALGWALTALPAVGFFALAALVFVVVVVVADGALAWVAVQLLRSRVVARRTVARIAGAALIARAIDVWFALSPVPQVLPGLEAIPGFVPLFLAPVVAIAAWLVIRTALRWAREGAGGGGPPEG